MYIQGTKRSDDKVMFKFMLEYLKWCLKIKGLHATINLYHRFKNQTPQWIQVLNVYSIYTELLSPVPNVGFLGQLYNDFLTEFNHDDNGE